MPHGNLDYSKTCIYKIVFGATCYYVGNTRNFTKRKTAHKSNCNNEKSDNHNLKIYQYMRANGWTGSFERGGWDMVLIEKYPCKDGLESSAREFHHYTLLSPSLNTNVPNRTPIQWRDDNPDIIKKNHARNNPRLNAIHNVIKKNCPHCNKEMLKTTIYKHIKICKSRPIEPVADNSMTSQASASSPLPTPDAVLE